MEGMGVAIEWGVNNRARQPKKEKSRNSPSSPRVNRLPWSLRTLISAQKRQLSEDAQCRHRKLELASLRFARR